MAMAREKERLERERKQHGKIQATINKQKW
jgi:hypothetical protein